MNIFKRVRMFTFFPRRFYSHSWGGDGLHFTRWWQWGRRCFFVRTKTFVRPNFSTWVQLLNRTEAGDQDAKIIMQCIDALSYNTTYTGLQNWVIYDIMVDHAKE